MNKHLTVLDGHVQLEQGRWITQRAYDYLMRLIDSNVFRIVWERELILETLRQYHTGDLKNEFIAGVVVTYGKTTLTYEYVQAVGIVEFVQETDFQISLGQWRHFKIGSVPENRGTIRLNDIICLEFLKR